MRIFRVKLGNKSYVVEVEDVNQAPVRVRVNGRSYEVEVEWQGADSEATVRPDILPSAPERDPDTGASNRLPLPPTPQVSEAEKDTTATIDAPMPGTIISIAVQRGDHVARGDEICLLEAMKMRNSIKSPRAGEIAEVFVTPGTKVAYGAHLVRFASAPMP